MNLLKNTPRYLVECFLISNFAKKQESLGYI